MMEENTIYIVGVIIILLVGLFIVLISKRLNISSILILLLAGIGLGRLEYNGEKMFILSPAFLSVLAIVALILVVFDATSRFRWKTIDVYTVKTFKLMFIFFILCMIGLTVAVSLIFNVQNILLALAFSSLMAGTSPDLVLSLLKEGKKKTRGVKHKIVDMLRIESILSTPLTIIIPLILIELAGKIDINKIISSSPSVASLSIANTHNAYNNAFVVLLSSIKPVALELLVGISAGIFAGLILAYIFKHALPERLSPLILMAGALGTYLLAEVIGGNGLLGVIAMGLLFGNHYIRQKEYKYSFSSALENSLLILVFILIGFAIDVPLGNLSLWIDAFILFIIYLIIRFITVSISLNDEELTIKEKVFMTLNVPKGIGVAIVVFALATKASSATNAIQGLDLILDLIIIFMIFSIVLASLVCKLSSVEPKHAGL
jgi:CPA1 family monovalent cation:H+ antiporter